MKTINYSSCNKKLIENKKESQIDRKFVSTLGNNLYSQKEVSSIGIKIGFKDGSLLVFEKDEDEEDKTRKLLDKEEK